MDDLQIAFREDATSVALIVANGEFWLWFTTEPGHRLRPQIIARDQIEELTANHFSDAEAKVYLETSDCRRPGTSCSGPAIQSEDIAVWKIRSD